MKAPIYTEQDLAKYGKQLAPITQEQIKLETWLCGWVFVKHSSGHIVKCEATRDNKWRILGTKGAFPIEEGQLYFGTKKPTKKKEW